MNNVVSPNRTCKIEKEANALKTSINLLRNIIAKTIEYLSQKGQYEDFLKEAEFNTDEKKILSYIQDISNKQMTYQPRLFEFRCSYGDFPAALLYIHIVRELIQQSKRDFH